MKVIFALFFAVFSFVGFAQQSVGYRQICEIHFDSYKAKSAGGQEALQKLSKDKERKIAVGRLIRDAQMLSVIEAEKFHKFEGIVVDKAEMEQIHAFASENVELWATKYGQEIKDLEDFKRACVRMSEIMTKFVPAKDEAKAHIPLMQIRGLNTLLKEPSKEVDGSYYKKFMGDK